MDPSSLFNSFYDKISQVIDKHIPIKQLSKKELKFQSKPWITPAIRVSISVKNNLYKKFLKSKSSYYHCKFKMYRNKLNHLLKISKKKYYNSYFLQNANNTKRIWNGIKEIVHFKNKISHNITKISKNNAEATDSRQIADMFNNYFATIGNDLASQIPGVNKSPMSYLHCPSSKSFYLFPITSNEIEDHICNLKTGKATGPFSIPINILKILRTILSKPLETIFNASLTFGLVPKHFKEANVIPIYKKGCRADVSNYRPISLLSIFNKLLEKLICKRLLDYLDMKNVIFKNQFGFRVNHSTNHAISAIIEKIQSAIDQRDFSCWIFLDFSKAFDTVNHSILLKKLEYYGIRGIAKDWFLSYFSDRTQTVTINNIKSDPLPITCGVPQGSVLGPLLFLLYINDFYTCSNLFDFHLFADDANLFYRHKDIPSLVRNINIELIKVHTWLCANKLSLNIEKSNFVIFHPPQRKITYNVELKLNDKLLKQEKCIKYLGIFIDSNLSWKAHINHICMKIKILWDIVKIKILR